MSNDKLNKLRDTLANIEYPSTHLAPNNPILREGFKAGFDAAVKTQGYVDVPREKVVEQWWGSHATTCARCGLNFAKLLGEEKIMCSACNFSKHSTY